MTTFSRKYSTYEEAMAVKIVLTELEFADAIHVTYLPKTEEFLVESHNHSVGSVVDISN